MKGHVFHNTSGDQYILSLGFFKWCFQGVPLRKHVVDDKAARRHSFPRLRNQTCAPSV